jgi:glycosyltransferase involved in cell wall biosynthesis
MSGAALAATDIGGHREYALHESTALLSPPKDPHALAANLLRLVQDRELRLRLAAAGNRFMQQFTWERATDAMEGLLRAELAGRNPEPTAAAAPARAGANAAAF